MTIQIDGTNTVNKGAELMLYSILKEIEHRYPNASVVYNSSAGSVDQIDTTLAIKRRFWLTFWRYPKAILSRFNLKHDYDVFSVYHPAKKIHLLLDAGGFQFSDQWNHSGKFLTRLEKYYKTLKKHGTKIILLPQAFGPFETSNGRECAAILNHYVDLLIAREPTSKQYLLSAGVASDKVWQYTDFTGLMDGALPSKYDFIKNRICIIPNKKMFTHSPLQPKQYFQFVKKVCDAAKEKGQEVFLLNHEGVGDLAICKQINDELGLSLPIISGLNSKEIKGVIGASYAVISSRFHGVASSLTQGVPCLATSWSHKYKLLFNDFGQSEMVLDLHNDFEKSVEKTVSFLGDSRNAAIRQHLLEKKQEIKAINRKMWGEIWTYSKSK
ncbi:polysaccharide pyruvyl transferase family protein [Parapedobacter tibetensis]|uniref:polysaccharide pyruvyl transferase family protein n=1 Tax=Parapedobacter tibetensis TaxID=2972951 RepID=UPI00214D41C4|nr:polysaccharide pyruvyl transferase family protein [Parapedobacter tibetensis]